MTICVKALPTLPCELWGIYSLQGSTMPYGVMENLRYQWAPVELQVPLGISGAVLRKIIRSGLHLVSRAFSRPTPRFCSHDDRMQAESQPQGFVRIRVSPSGQAHSNI